MEWDELSELQLPATLPEIVARMTEIHGAVRHPGPGEVEGLHIEADCLMAKAVQLLAGHQSEDAGKLVQAYEAACGYFWYS